MLTGQNSECTSTRRWWGRCPGLLLLGASTLLPQTPGLGRDSLSCPNIPALSTAGKWTALSKLSPRIIPH
ncbi:similar to 25 kDa brain-specific protein (p25-alpha) (predicted), isoform CRA_b, partial [Rattus norvegicus]